MSRLSLEQDQVNNDGKKEYCNAELDSADDKKKLLEKGVSDLETAVVDSKDGIVSTKAEIEALDDGIKACESPFIRGLQNSNLQR